jgi:hypothetical protein
MVDNKAITAWRLLIVIPIFELSESIGRGVNHPGC